MWNRRQASLLRALKDSRGRIYSVQRAKKPQFGFGAGRAWDKVLFSINGHPLPFWNEWSYGRYWYFEWEGLWYKIPNSEMQEWRGTDFEIME